MAVLGPLVLRAPDPHEEPAGLTRRSRGGRRTPEYRREVDEPSSRAPRWLGPVALVAIVGFGAAVRAAVAQVVAESRATAEPKEAWRFSGRWFSAHPIRTRSRPG